MNDFLIVRKIYFFIFLSIFYFTPSVMAQNQNLEKRVENLEKGISEIKDLLQKSNHPTSGPTNSSSQSTRSIESPKNIDPINLAKGAMMEIWKINDEFDKNSPAGISAGVFIDKSNVMKLTNFESRKDLKNFLRDHFAVKWTGLIKVESSGEHAAILEAYTDRNPGGSFNNHIFVRINGELIVSMSNAKNNSYLRDSSIDTNTINLEPGFHKIEIFAYAKGRGMKLSLISYKFSLRHQSQATAKTYSPAEMFYTK